MPNNPTRSRSRLAASVLALARRLAVASLLALGFGAQLPGDARQTSEEPVSPFRAMREAGGALEVQIDDDTWYRLERLDTITAAELVAFAKNEFGARWWKRVTEDLVFVCRRMGHEPGVAVDLVLRVGDAAPITRTQVPMTAANRRALWLANKAPAPVAARDLRGMSKRQLIADAPRVSPFRAMREAGASLEVQVDDETWYRLDQLNGVAAADLVAFARAEFGEAWWKRITEDLVAVLVLMGKEPGPTADLVLRAGDTSAPITRLAVPMTEAKRRALWQANRSADRDERGATRRLDASAVAADLAELGRLLDERFAYRHRRPVDAKALLAGAKQRLGGGAVDGRQLAIEVDRVLAAFGDGHAGVRGDVLADERFLPFLVADAHGGAVAFATDRSRLLDPEHPFLVELDGRPLSAWLDVAATVVADGSPQLRRARALRNLRYLDTLRATLGIERTGPLTITLADAAGARVRRTVEPAQRKPIYGSWPLGTHRLLGDVGYLRLASMDDDPRFLDGLDAAMQRCKGTRGLILDVRGNGGGSRAALRRLFPYFMRDDAPAHVANIAAYRLAPGDDPHRPDGYLADRVLHPAQWQGWDGAARSAIAAAERRFRPEWQPPAGDFSDWHFFVLQRGDNAKAWHYTQPVVVLLDEGCFSATDIFLGAFAGWPDVTLLGTPSSGGSARAETFVLPSSRLAVRLASMASFRPSGKLYDGNGITPDVIVAREAGDLVGTGDAQLDAALARLR
ncbi:MAG: S41 family peptidase [Planctomycetota bacterium]